MSESYSRPIRSIPAIAENRVTPNRFVTPTPV